MRNDMWNLEINGRLDTEDMNQLITVIIGLNRNHFQYLEHGDYIFQSCSEKFEISLHAISYLTNKWWDVSFYSDTCEIKR